MPAIMKFVLFSSVTCWLMASAPSLMFALSIVWGITLVLSAMHLNRTRLFLLFAVNIGILYLFGGNSPAFSVMTLMGVPFLIMALLLRSGRGYYELQKWGMLAGLAAVLLFMGTTYLSLGNDAIQAIDRQVESYIQNSVEVSRESGLMEFYEQNGISSAEVESSVASISHTLIKYLPALYCLQMIFLIYLVLVLSAMIARKKQLPILAKKPFKEEIMPWQLAWVVIVGLALWLWGRNEMSVIYYAGANLLTLALPVTVYFGTANLAYQASRLKPGIRKWAISLFILLSFIFALSAILFIGLLGLFDSLLDNRKLRTKED